MRPPGESAEVHVVRLAPVEEGLDFAALVERVD